MGREVYTIGQIGKRVVGVCRQHTRSLNVRLSLQFYQEGDVRRLKREGVGATAIAKELGIGRASVYRILSD